MRTLSPISGRPLWKCTYRRTCENKATINYVVPTVTRWGNLSTRTSQVCEECAAVIRTVYSNVIDA
jgi:hypothetical protein